MGQNNSENPQRNSDLTKVQRFFEAHDMGQKIGVNLFESDALRAGRLSDPFDPVKETLKNFRYLDSNYVSIDHLGDDTDLRDIDRYNEKMHEEFSSVESFQAMKIIGDHYEILVKERNLPDPLLQIFDEKQIPSTEVIIDSIDPMADNLMVAEVRGQENIERNFKGIVEDREFEQVVRDLNNYTDIDDYLHQQEVYVEGVNDQLRGPVQRDRSVEKGCEFESNNSSVSKEFEYS